MSPETDSLEWLARFVRERDEAAFSELVRRYAGLVHAAALRRADGNGAMAEDASQLVFLELVRNAPRLLERTRTAAPLRLGGWLHRCALSVTADLMKSERRRAARENRAGRAADMALAWESAPAPEGTLYAQCAPLIDGILESLGDRDRDAVMLRFFEGRSFQSIGERLGTTEDTAHKRVSRALDRMRAALRRQGIVSTSSLLGAFLSAHAAPPPPAGLAEQVTAAAGRMIHTVFPPPFSPPCGPGPMAFPGPASLSPVPASVFPVSPNLITTLAMKLTRRLLPAAAFTAAVLSPLLYWRLTGPPVVSPVSGNSSSGPPEETAVLSPAPGVSGKPAAARPGRGAGTPAAASTEETRRAELRRTAEERAQEKTRQGYDEVMALLKTKFSLTPEQETALADYHQAQRQKWVRYLVGATLREADPALYHLEAGYREKIPPSLQPLLTPEQLTAYQEWDQRRRTNHVEAVTTGELGYLADRLDLSPDQKDRLFASLSGINGTDLFTDVTGIHSLEEIASQADHDVSRRREAFARDLSAGQMEEWEKVVTGYREQLLERFGGKNGSLATSSAAPAATSQG